MTRRLPIAVVLGVLAAVLLVPELFGLAEVLPFAQLVAFRPAAAVGLVVLAVVVVLVWRRRWPVALAVWVVAAGVLGVAAPRAIAGQPPGPGRTLILLSLNVYDGHADVPIVARLIHTARPDVVVLPEAGERYRQLLTSHVADLRYRSWTTEPPESNDVNGIVVLAAPWLGAVTAEPLPLHTTFRWMQMTGGGLGVVRVVAVHAAAPVPELIQKWTFELMMLQQWCGPGRGTNIVIGDFNATLDHNVLRRTSPAALTRRPSGVRVWWRPGRRLGPGGSACRSITSLLPEGCGRRAYRCSTSRAVTTGRC
jgi:endonuclease/exonuclease/phosphatase (EEP) superfamily protein YafD